MTVRYAKSYIDRLFISKDIAAIYDVIKIVRRDRELPEEFLLFSRLMEWSGYSRSGIWQYYEGISADDFIKIAISLEHFGLSELAQRYRSGMSDWMEPNRCTELDDWIFNHWDDLDEIAFNLIEKKHDIFSQIANQIV